MAQALIIDKNKYTKRFFYRLEKRRTEEKYDFTILVGSQVIYAEQNVLACGSDYFNAMFLHETEEKQTGRVEMHGVDFESVKTCIDFIYRKDVEVLPEKYENLMCAADMMQLTELRDAIEKNMEKNLNVTSFFSLLKIANKFSCGNLQNKCQTFAENNFYAITICNGFLESELSFLTNLLLTKRSPVGEDEKLQSILKWVRHSLEDRKKSLITLIRCIDISKLDPARGRWYIENETLINTDNECLLLFSLSVIDAARSPLEGASSILASSSVEKEIMLAHENIDHLQIFNPEGEIRNYCSGRPEHKNQQHRFSLVLLNHSVYSLGADKSVYCQDYTDCAYWARKPDMLEVHGKCPPAVAHSGYVYVIGGHFGKSTDLVERFDPVRNVWKKVATAQNVRALSSIVSFGGFIYSFGGWMANGWTNEASRLNCATGHCEIMAPMKEKKGAVAACACNELIFVSGGFRNIAGGGGANAYRYISKTFEQYDPLLNQWTVLPQMILPRYCHRLHAIQGELYAVGGHNHPKLAIEKYGIMTKTWTIVAKEAKIIDSVLIIDSFKVH